MPAIKNITALALLLSIAAAAPTNTNDNERKLFPHPHPLRAAVALGTAAAIGRATAPRTVVYEQPYAQPGAIVYGRDRERQLKGRQGTDEDAQQSRKLHFHGHLHPRRFRRAVAALGAATLIGGALGRATAPPVVYEQPGMVYEQPMIYGRKLEYSQ